MKHQNCSMGPADLVPLPKCSSLGYFPESNVSYEEITSSNEHEYSKVGIIYLMFRYITKSSI